MELLGYDSRKFKFAAFVLAAAIAALAGVLYAVWGNFVAPEMFNLNQAAQVVIWVIVGGRSTLIGPIVGTGLVQYFGSGSGRGHRAGDTRPRPRPDVVRPVFREGLLPTIGRFLGLLGRRFRAARPA